jgi:hypothetical protein
MEHFIEITLTGYDALCVDPNQGFFREGRRDSYKILCKVPAAWVGAEDFPQRLLSLAESVNTDQTNALLQQGSMVGHFLLKVMAGLGYGCRDQGLLFSINAHLWSSSQCLGEISSSTTNSSQNSMV